VFGEWFNTVETVPACSMKGTLARTHSLWVRFTHTSTYSNRYGGEIQILSRHF